MEKQFVSDVNIDIMGLCNEAQECGVDAIVIEAGADPLLLVREDLLCSTSDIFTLSDEHVGPSWGYDHVQVLPSSKGMFFYPNTEDGHELYGWRARTVPDENLDFAAQQLAALRQMGRQVPVTVRSI